MANHVIEMWVTFGASLGDKKKYGEQEPHLKAA